MNKKTVFAVLALLDFCVAEVRAQELNVEERLARLEQELDAQQEKQKHTTLIRGILRGKYEYATRYDANRFEVRNARLSVDGTLPLKSSYKLEVDLCDESQIKMKDAWVNLNPYKTLRATIGQQRMPFTIDAHRNPSAQYFANRSFIAKQVGNMRDVGVLLGYDFRNAHGTLLSVDAGLFNGSNIDNQKTAWFSSPAYSARIHYFPIKGLAVVPSIQHRQIADRRSSYTSIDFGAYYEFSAFHIEAEYLRKFYAHGAFSDCNAVDAMAIYKMPMLKKGFLNGISYLLRYDYMGNHSDGEKGFAENTTLLQQSDAERHRLTAGLTLHVANKYFPTDIRLNYEKYRYTNGGTPKESEQDKLVTELMIRF